MIRTRRAPFLKSGLFCRVVLIAIVAVLIRGIATQEWLVIALAALGVALRAFAVFMAWVTTVAALTTVRSRDDLSSLAN